MKLIIFGCKKILKICERTHNLRLFFLAMVLQLLTVPFSQVLPNADLSWYIVLCKKISGLEQKIPWNWHYPDASCLINVFFNKLLAFLLKWFVVFPTYSFIHMRLISYRKSSMNSAFIFNFTFRYVDNILSLNTSKFDDYVECKYLVDLLSRSHIQGSPRKFHSGLNRTYDPWNALFIVWYGCTTVWLRVLTNLPRVM